MEIAIIQYQQQITKTNLCEYQFHYIEKSLDTQTFLLYDHVFCIADSSINVKAQSLFPYKIAAVSEGTSTYNTRNLF